MLQFKQLDEDKDNEINELKWNISLLKLQKDTVSNEQVTQDLTTNTQEAIHPTSETKHMISKTEQKDAQKVAIDVMDEYTSTQQPTQQQNQQQVDNDSKIRELETKISQKDERIVDMEEDINNKEAGI